MILVEGPDGAGKTTLVQHIAEKYKIGVEERVVDKNTNPIYEDLKHWTEVNLKKGLQHKIFDRHRLISEPIYATAMGRMASPGFDDINWMTARHLDLTRIRPFMVFCIPSYEAVCATLEGDEDNEAVAPHIEQIYPLYVATAAGYVARGQAVMHNYQADPDYKRFDMLFGLWLKNNRLRMTKAVR